MKNLRIVVSLPNDNAYQHEQGIVAKSTGERLGLDLQVIHANDDSITQSQQLLEIIQSKSEPRPSAFLVEPVTGTGLRRVAEAAVAEGIAWVVSNSDVDYVEQLRKKPRVPVFIVTQGQHEMAGCKASSLPHFCLTGDLPYTSRGRARVPLRSSDTRAWTTPSRGMYK